MAAYAASSFELIATTLALSCLARRARAACSRCASSGPGPSSLRAAFANRSRPNVMTCSTASKTCFRRCTQGVRRLFPSERHIKDTSSFAERNQSSAGLLSLPIAGCNHEGAARRRKLGWHGQRVHGLTVRHVSYPLGLPLNRIRNRGQKVTACRTPPGHFSGSGHWGPHPSKVRGRSRRPPSPWPYPRMKRTLSRAASAPAPR